MCCCILYPEKKRKANEVINCEFQVEERLCETEPDASTLDLEKTDIQLVSISGDSASEHQEDLVEGDLGLGTAPALTREA